MLEHGGVQVQRYTFSGDTSSDTLAGQARAFGEAMATMVPVFERLAPTFVLVYGDRGEAFAAALATARMGIPVVHVEGGCTTEGGCLDDSARHSLTKLASLHFPVTEQSAAAIVAMGEEPWRVKVCGLPILDFVVAGDFAGEAETRERFQVPADRPVVVFCQHPVAAELRVAREQIESSLTALDMAAAVHQIWPVVLAPNGDAGSDIFREAMTARGFDVFENLGRCAYHGLLAIAACIVGNSSAGIKEAPAFACPTVNVGTRQSGRLGGPSVVTVPYCAEDIARAIAECLGRRMRVASGPYRALGAGRIIAETLATVELNGLTIKRKAA